MLQLQQQFVIDLLCIFLCEKSRKDLTLVGGLGEAPLEEHVEYFMFKSINLMYFERKAELQDSVNTHCHIMTNTHTVSRHSPCIISIMYNS